MVQDFEQNDAKERREADKGTASYARLSSAKNSKNLPLINILKISIFALANQNK